MEAPVPTYPLLYLENILPNVTKTKNRSHLAEFRVQMSQDWQCLSLEDPIRDIGWSRAHQGLLGHINRGLEVGWGANGEIGHLHGSGSETIMSLREEKNRIFHKKKYILR